jgi:hypothetical protein
MPQKTWRERSDAHSRSYIDAWANFAPEAMSIYGVEGLGEATQQLPPDLLDQQIETFGNLLGHTRKLLARERHPELCFDLELIESTTERLLAKLEVERDIFLPYFNPVEIIYNGLTSQGPGREGAHSILARLRSYAGLGKNKSLAVQAEKLARAHLESATFWPYRGKIEHDLFQLEPLVGALRDLLAANPELDPKAVDDAFTPLTAQLCEWSDFARRELLPRSRGDYRLPSELYSAELRQLGVTLAPDELIRRARFAFHEIGNELRALAPIAALSQGLHARGAHDALRQLREQQIPPEALVGFYRDRLRWLRELVESSGFATLPEVEIRIRLAHPGENLICPGPHLRMPPLLAERLRALVLDFVLPIGALSPVGVQALVDYLCEAMVPTLTIHEAMPGHGMHFAAALAADLPLARIFFDLCPALIEGWAQYAEAELRPDLAPGAQLVALQQRRLRAARAFLDPELHLGRLEPAEARQLLIDEVGLSEVLAEQEVERYTLRMPGQATAYFAGYQALVELRATVEARWGRAFDRRKFHDRLLGAGYFDFEPAQMTRVSG